MIRVRRRTIAVIAVCALPSAICVLATAMVYTAFRIPPPVRLSEAERSQVMAGLRAALDGAPDPGAPAVHRAIAVPLAVTVWSHGASIARVDAAGTDLAEASVAAARALRAQAAVQALPAAERAAARLQVDLVTGTAPLRASWLFDHLAIPGISDLLAVNPGVDGIGAAIAGASVLILPHELVGGRLLAVKRPSPLFPDLATGIDLAQIGGLLAQRAHRSGPIAPDALFRFRTDTFVEPPGHAGAPLPLYRGVPPAPPLTGQTLREAALRGGRYLVAHLASNGRYVYEHDLWTGSASDPLRPSGSYSLPRHAGTTYFLAELYRITHEPWLREPIERALGHLATLVSRSGCAGTLPDGTAFDCVLDRGEDAAQLGATALAVVALAEYQRATGDPRYRPLAERLTVWLLFMQRPDGSFRHLYRVQTRTVDEQAQLLYASGEAALALARMHAITGEARYAAAAGRALDWLVGWYDFFIGGLFFGEEHWTCIAAEALWPAVARDAYVAFCSDYGAFLRAQQPAPGDHPDQDDLAGAYAVTPFLVPYNTPAGSRTEAMISAYLLGDHHGAPDRRLADQIRAALSYLLGQQIRPDSDFDVIGQGDGAIPATPIDRNIRIDYVQHVCSAMIRASAWIERSEAGGEGDSVPRELHRAP